MAVTKNDVVEYLKGMTLLEASELVKELEEGFGVSAAAAAAPVAVAAAAGGGGEAAAAEEKDAFDAVFRAAGGNEIAVNKDGTEVVVGLGFTEAQRLVDCLPQSITEGD